MIIKSKMIRDTAILTVMQLFLDSAALLLNVFITKQLGSSAIGILSLMGSFLGLAGILSNGNAFLCTSRLISEEIGKPCGNPNKILFYGIKLCMLLSLIVSAAVIMLADKTGALDAPDARKVHKKPIPRIGGLPLLLQEQSLPASRVISMPAAKHL